MIRADLPTNKNERLQAPLTSRSFHATGGRLDFHSIARPGREDKAATIGTAAGLQRTGLWSGKGRFDFPRATTIDSAGTTAVGLSPGDDRHDGPG